MGIMIDSKSVIDTLGVTSTAVAVTAETVEPVGNYLSEAVGEGVKYLTAILIVIYWIYKISESRAKIKMYREATKRNEIINDD